MPPPLRLRTLTVSTLPEATAMLRGVRPSPSCTRMLTRPPAASPSFNSAARPTASPDAHSLKMLHGSSVTQRTRLMQGHRQAQHACAKAKQTRLPRVRPAQQRPHSVRCCQLVGSTAHAIQHLVAARRCACYGSMSCDAGDVARVDCCTKMSRHSTRSTATYLLAGTQHDQQLAHVLRVLLG
jgi:hypothetical protein